MEVQVVQSAILIIDGQITSKTFHFVLDLKRYIECYLLMEDNRFRCIDDFLAYTQLIDLRSIDSDCSLGMQYIPRELYEDTVHLYQPGLPQNHPHSIQHRLMYQD